MIKKMLDTNICIYIAKKQPPEIVYKFSQYRRGEVAMSSISWAEFSCGISKDGKEATNKLLSLLDIIPFGQKAAEVYAFLTRSNPNRRANFDRLIAAHAISLDVPLVTNNIVDFSLYEMSGLRLENWIYSERT